MGGSTVCGFSWLILERSGIGAVTILESFGIKPLADLPGVGENYQGMFKSSFGYNSLLRSLSDHTAIIAPYLAGEEAGTMDTLFRGETQVNSEYNAALYCRHLGCSSVPFILSVVYTVGQRRQGTVSAQVRQF